MNNKMTINPYLSTIASKKKLSKQENRDRITCTESILRVARWEGGVREWVKR